MKREQNRKANIWTARVIPFLLLGLLIYSSWVITKLLCVDYLLAGSISPPKPRETASAIVILILYYLLLLSVLICYGRLIQTVLTNPGYVPRSEEWYRQKEEQARQGRQDKASAKRFSGSYEKRTLKGDDVRHRGEPEEDFWRRDLFLCQYDGRPAFCSQCFTFKVDRVHHCSEVNRCVAKMDHFCPWVGGIISGNSFKFFIQFNFYAAIFTGFALIVMAYYFAQRRSLDSSFVNAHWILVLAFAALFFLFTSGMFGSSLQLSLINSTTVENLSRKSRIYYIATYIARPEETIRRVEASGKPPLRLITYPRPPDENVTIVQHHGGFPPAALAASPTNSSPASPPGATSVSRTFAIIETPPGFNPWDVSSLENLKTVLGERPIDWFLPVKHSPCTNHYSTVSMYKMNPEIARFRRAAGIVDALDGENPGEDEGTGRKRRRRRRRRRRSSHMNRHDSGAERPDSGSSGSSGSGGGGGGGGTAPSRGGGPSR